jgi:hypothetical protein
VSLEAQHASPLGNWGSAISDEVSTVKRGFRAGEDRSPPNAEELVESFESHGEAERAVNELLVRGFPVEGVAIVARGLRLVEQVTGPMPRRRAALKGAAAGVLVGIPGGLLLGAVGWWFAGFALVLWGLILGFVLRAVVDWASHRPGHDGQDFDSITTVRATYFDVVAPSELAEEAAVILDEAQYRDYDRS